MDFGGKIRGYNGAIHFDPVMSTVDKKYGLVIGEKGGGINHQQPKPIQDLLG